MNGPLQPPEPHDRPDKPAVERRDIASRERLQDRVLAEFKEMPCLRLTPEQAQRLFGLREDISSRVISALLRQGEVRLDSGGRYTRD